MGANVISVHLKIIGRAGGVRTQDREQRGCRAGEITPEEVPRIATADGQVPMP